jgi:hypothetical protein
LDGKFAAFDFTQRSAGFIGDFEAREIFELAVEITEGGGLCHVKIGSPTCELTGGGCWVAGRAEKNRRGGGGVESAKEAVKPLVDTANALESGDGFLADIATFVEIHAAVFESRFLRERIFGEFAAPERDAVQDAEEFDFGGGEFWEVRGFFGRVEAGEVESGDGKESAEFRRRVREGAGVFPVLTSRPLLGGSQSRREDVVERVGNFNGQEFDVVGDDVTLEPGSENFGEFGGGFDEEGIAGTPDEKRGAEFAFRREEAGGAGFGGLQARNVDADLAVEIAEGVRAAEFEADAVADLEK